jgi:hypothetical protein
MTDRPLAFFIPPTGLERRALERRIASLRADTNDIRFSKFSRETTGRMLRAAERELSELPAPATCPTPHRQAA